MNISPFVTELTEFLQEVQRKDMLTRAVAVSMLPVVHDRIHVQGKAADGSLISPEGYSESYLLRRVREYHRTPSSLVILSATRQMETDFSVVADGSGGYGLGFKNKINFDKANWMEALFDKVIYALTEEEVKIATEAANTYAEQLKNGLS